MIFVGDDWAEAHHDVYVCDEAGTKLAVATTARRASRGSRSSTTSSPSHADDPGEVVVGIETDRGLWVQALVEAGYVVYAINPRAASRYRDRHTLSGAKSDPGDAKMLAELVRTDRHNHRQVAGDTRSGRGHQGPGSGASEPDLGTHPGNEPAASVRCASTSPQRSTRSLSWPIATRSPCWRRRRRRPKQPS